MNKKKSSQIARIAIFFGLMLVIQYLTTTVFSILPLPIKPTLVHIPVIIASIAYGWRTGVLLGGLMGLLSLITNSLVISPASYLFSPFVEGGNLYSVLIAIIPRFLIGLSPYLVYCLMKNKVGLILAGALGSLTNTVFVLSGIFLFFAERYNGNVKLLLASILTINSLAEMLLASFFTATIVPRLIKFK
ncbi:ECF transporter S component [Streptococcus sp. sy010]|uniref:ECF transporter S component n=1 Tax=Streptococcus sp. sy010 TaxID=2600148 RepID=UPI0011B643F6|nr:ECF transporter S component [Streptococcus sp. sy010]TWT16703.1 ECF transporter S component [Streptococcus sp. sy010]